MKIAVEGCAHGELEKIYDTIQSIEKRENIKVDLLLCCGDFQATRNLEDLQTMAVPKKYQDICSFYKYYSGEKVAPILTIFIGGNHEASNYLQELPYGGWVAPNIYYLGFAGVVRVNGIRIGGLSGIYKGHDFLRGHHEFAPYSESTKKSVYHVRQLEVYRLKQLSGKIDIFMSHDWPRGIYNYGNKAQLLRFKPHFRDEVEQDQLGSRPCEELLNKLRPAHWFAAHLHCKFAAIVTHEDSCGGSEVNAHDDYKTQPETDHTQECMTKFLALDKCLPKRRFLQLLDIDSAEHTDEGEIKFEHDLEWLTVLYLTNHLINVKNANHYMPGPKGGMNNERYNFTPTAEEIEYVRRKFGGDLQIARNFCRTVEPYNPNEIQIHPMQPKAQINPQSMQFCDTLGIDDPLSLAMLISGHELSHSSTLESSDMNESSLTLDENSSLNSSLTCDHSLPIHQISPIKRKSGSGLHLPQPALNSDNTNTSLQHLIDSPPSVDDNLHREDSVHLEDSVQSTPCVEGDNAIETSDLESDPVDLNSKPPIKKFKRRNQDIYKDNDDE